MQSIGNKLRQQRERRGISQATLAARADLGSRHVIARIECDCRAMNAVELLRALAALGMSIDEFSDAFATEPTARFSWRRRPDDTGSTDPTD